MTFAIDMATLIFLFFCLPAVRSIFPVRQKNESCFATDLTNILFGGFAVFVLAATFAAIIFGNINAAYAFILNEPILAPKRLNLGVVKPGEIIHPEIKITNQTNQPVKLIGGTTNCFCVTTREMPLTIEPGKTVGISLEIKAPFSTSGLFVRPVELWTDCVQAGTLKIQIGGQIKD